jgi:hypothetical protein
LNTGQFDEETLCCPSQFEHLLVLPVVKLEFECPEDLDKAIKTEIIILAEGKKEIVLERKRNSKIVRCFNCEKNSHFDYLNWMFVRFC